MITVLGQLKNYYSIKNCYNIKGIKLGCCVHRRGVWCQNGDNPA